MSEDRGDGRITVECRTHGSQSAAVVCCHLVDANGGDIGFIENSSDPDDQQAWCGACERKFVEERSMTPAFRAFNDMKVVCSGCYARIKRDHSN